MNFNLGDIITLKGSKSYYKVLSIEKNRLTKLANVDSKFNPLIINGKELTIESWSTGWSMELFELVTSVFQGPLPKHHNVIQKIKSMDKRFSERKLSEQTN